MGATKEDFKQIRTENQEQNIEINSLRKEITKLIDLLKLKPRFDRLKTAIIGLGFVICLMALSYDVIAAAFLQTHATGIGFQQWGLFFVGLIIFIVGAIL